MTYCTPADVRGIAADGAFDGVPDLIIEAAVEEVTRVVDSFAGRFFGQRLGVKMVLRYNAALQARLPVDPTGSTAESITSVAHRYAPDSLLPEGFWRFLPGAENEPSVLDLSPHRYGHNLTTVGAEPWRGGYRNLWGHLADGHIIVTGDFGEVEIPAAVKTATAVLAAWSLNPASVASFAGGSLPGQSDLSNVKSLSVEGYSVTIHVPSVPERGRTIATTGLPSVDRLLLAHRSPSSGWGLS